MKVPGKISNYSRTCTWGSSTETTLLSWWCYCRRNAYVHVPVSLRETAGEISRSSGLSFITVVEITSNWSCQVRAVGVAAGWSFNFHKRMLFIREDAKGLALQPWDPGNGTAFSALCGSTLSWRDFVSTFKHKVLTENLFTKEDLHNAHTDTQTHTHFVGDLYRPNIN